MPRMVGSVKKGFQINFESNSTPSQAWYCTQQLMLCLKNGQQNGCDRYLCKRGALFLCRSNEQLPGLGGNPRKVDSRKLLKTIGLRKARKILFVIQPFLARCMHYRFLRIRVGTSIRSRRGRSLENERGRLYSKVIIFNACLASSPFDCVLREGEDL
jgi:hypothetical protein